MACKAFFDPKTENHDDHRVKVYRHTREPHTPFHGKPNEPITYRPDEIPKT